MPSLPLYGPQCLHCCTRCAQVQPLVAGCCPPPPGTPPGSACYLLLVGDHAPSASLFSLALTPHGTLLHAPLAAAPMRTLPAAAGRGMGGPLPPAAQLPQETAGSLPDTLDPAWAHEHGGPANPVPESLALVQLEQGVHGACGADGAPAPAHAAMRLGAEAGAGAQPVVQWLVGLRDGGLSLYQWQQQQQHESAVSSSSSSDSGCCLLWQARLGQLPLQLCSMGPASPPPPSHTTPTAHEGPGALSHWPGVLAVGLQGCWVVEVSALNGRLGWRGLGEGGGGVWGTSLALHRRTAGAPCGWLPAMCLCGMCVCIPALRATVCWQGWHAPSALPTAFIPARRGSAGCRRPQQQQGQRQQRARRSCLVRSPPRPQALQPQQQQHHERRHGRVQQHEQRQHGWRGQRELQPKRHEQPPPR